MRITKGKFWNTKVKISKISERENLKKKENINTENFGEISEDFKNEKIFFLFGFQNFRLGKKNFESHLFQYPFSKCSVAKFPCLKLKILKTKICKTKLQKT